ncbi:hypothetical protein ASE75_06465 [Sphingomonas sp. Leaf17]|uniref:hypothetical protein n=1 Tax=Sphingomonas sp. Leaf17 TaxID=1735683 RepID=UPI0006F77E14|nr:hypothetical protein [Sphingomonas sp. Leaf17]KQM65982.1 hypothetical protein ASE75_06465 [Sphingomonas sp. Leaf17]
MTVSRLFRPLPVFAGLALLATGGVVLAQIEGGTRGSAPIDSSGDYEVGGITVDVGAKSADAARLGGWRIAQRKGWQQLSRRLGGGGAMISDGALDSIVSGIVVENEQIGLTRYVARLGVLFDRGRAGAILGIASYESRSAPMLVIPVVWSGGVGQVFEQRTAWQQAWARYRTGNSSIDYARPAGTGPDALLLNVGQTGRPGRGWWRTILNQYGASDVLIPVVTLQRQYPGGPVIGQFQARHGPDNRFLGSFSLKVATSAGIPQLLDAGVKRMDDLYQAALRSGYLRPDASLLPPPAPEPVVDDTVIPTDALDGVVDNLPGVGAGIAITLQFETPNAGTVSATESTLRAIAGVRSADTTSLALGGVSLMRVMFDGDPAMLKTALEARGYQVVGSGQTIRIRRAATLPPPVLPLDDSTTRATPRP